MAIVTIPKGDWVKHLAAAIEAAQDGDTIIVHSEDMKYVGERAAARMRPDVELTFLVDTSGMVEE